MGVTVGESHKAAMVRSEQVTDMHFRRIQRLIDAGHFDPVQRARLAQTARFDPTLARQISAPLVEARLRGGRIAQDSLATAVAESSGGAFGGFGTRRSVADATIRLEDQIGSGVVEAAAGGVTGALQLSQFNADQVNRFINAAIAERFQAERDRLQAGLATYSQLFAEDRRRDDREDQQKHEMTSQFVDKLVPESSSQADVLAALGLGG